jgi:hypothetical protein
VGEGGGFNASTAGRDRANLEDYWASYATKQPAKIVSTNATKTSRIDIREDAIDSAVIRAKMRQ